MAKLLQLTIARVDGPVFDGEVISVTLPGTEGEMTVMADHEALVSALRAGTLTLKAADGTVQTFEVVNGTVEIHNNHATVLL
jgi:F-type H+-transporting ATPase subunit epsilon